MHAHLGVLGVTGFLMGDPQSNPIDYVEGGVLDRRRRELSEWLDSTDPDLSRFAARGGKLIVFHGLADTLVAPGQSVGFFDRHARQMGGAGVLADSARLFLAPGMMHCGGGTGPDAFNTTLGIPPRPPSDR